jgi:8-oxo-dGTP diphosphatase
MAVEHRISAGAMVEDDDKVLLVRYLKLGDEDPRATAKRGAIEECGLHIEPDRLLNIEEFVQPGKRHCKVRFAGHLVGGTFECCAPQARSEHIVEAAWLACDELGGRTVFPPMLLGEYWDDKAAGRTEPRYVGLRQMDFY